MKKAGRKWFFLYVLVGAIFLFMVFIIVFLNSKKESFKQNLNLNKQSTIPAATIIPTSSSDLSYIMVIADPDLDVRLLDMSGNQIAEASMQQSMTDPKNPENKNGSIKELYFQKPNTGSYQLITSGIINKNSKLSIYFYDINGDVNMAESETKGAASFSIYFDKENSKRSYVKNFSDMSDLSFAINEGITISVKDKNGNSVGKTYLDYGPGNPTASGASYKTPSPLTIFSYGKPPSGTYQIKLNSASSKNFQLDATFITQSGDIKTETIKGVVGPEGQVLNLTFDKSNMNNSHINQSLDK
mgnify:CR=1 FL=1